MLQDLLNCHHVPVKLHVTELLSGSGLTRSLTDDAENVVGIIPELGAGETKRFSVESKVRVRDI